MMIIRQINLNKSRDATSELCHYLRQDNFLAMYLITEPYLVKNRVPGLPYMYNVYGTRRASCRSVIIAPKQFPVFLNNELTDDDHTVVLYDDGKDQCYFASIYCDINKPSISNMQVKMCDFFK